MRYFLVPLMAFALFNTAPVFADHDCKCDKKCAEACSKGEGHECGCKACDCAKTGKCGEGKCDHHHDKDKSGAKGEVKKEEKKK